MWFWRDPEIWEAEGGGRIIASALASVSPKHRTKMSLHLSHTLQHHDIQLGWQVALIVRQRSLSKCTKCACLRLCLAQGHEAVLAGWGNMLLQPGEGWTGLGTWQQIREVVFQVWRLIQHPCWITGENGTTWTLAQELFQKDLFLLLLCILRWSR